MADEYGSIAFGTTYSGHLSSSNQSDRYRIVVTKPDRVSVTITSDGLSDALGTFNFDWEDSSGSSVRGHQISVFNNPPFTGTIDLEAGTYYFTIHGRLYIPGGFGNYNIRFDSTTQEPPQQLILSDWAQPEITKAREMDLIPDSLMLEGIDYTKPITRAEFAAVSVKVYEALSGTKAIPAAVNPFADTNDVEVLKAYNAGIAIGVSATNFDPNAILTREQAATMLTRVFKRVTIPNWTLAADAEFKLTYIMPARFPDDAKISDWASDSVYFMASNGIIRGMTNGDFAPRNMTNDEEARGYANSTREQALAIAVRMVENLR
jgi:hypothetical protein